MKLLMTKIMKEKNMPNKRHCETCGRELNDSYGKSLGCYECDKEFCSADCLIKHEKITGHNESLEE
jgi:hypothetical protein